MFADAPEFQKKAEFVELNRKSLIKISKGYHNYVCKDSQCVVYEKSLPPIKVEIGPNFGYGQYSAEPAVVMDRSSTTH
jgi:hypothetical protein